MITIVLLKAMIYNVYMSIVEKYLSSLGHECLIYANDLVVFTSNKAFKLAIKYHYPALKELSGILTRISFQIAPEKSKTVIFTQRRYLDHSDILLENNIIPTVSNVAYLGTTFGPKLRGLPPSLLLNKGGDTSNTII